MPEKSCPVKTLPGKILLVDETGTDAVDEIVNDMRQIHPDLEVIGLPITGRNGSMITSSTPKDPTMLANTTRSCIANSETPQPRGSVSVGVSVWVGVEPGSVVVPGNDSARIWPFRRALKLTCLPAVPTPAWPTLLA